ncbi:NUDIX domain-containing protein, partial [Candidatus Micrarchaeota archaeon]|nr:NUDIX domain-containing protein [Candidatus Micrarchaeota archaeon]
MEERAGGIIYCKKPLRIALAKQNHQGWTFPKGHVDEGETHLETAERECKEETGLKTIKLVKEIKILNRKSRNQQTDLAISMYLFEALKPSELKEKPDSE